MNTEPLPLRATPKKAKEVADALNKVLDTYKLPNISQDTVNMWQFSNPDGSHRYIFSDDSTMSLSLSSIITEHLWPKLNSAEVYHFTTADNANNIKESNILRLTSISKRFDENELKELCKREGLNTKRCLEIVGDSIFYVSFTGKDSSEETLNYLKKEFGPTKLSFLVSIPKESCFEFRKMKYKDSQDGISLIQEIQEILKNEFNCTFSPAKFFTLSSYYLPNGYAIENEYRLLIRMPQESKILSPPNTIPYLELTLGQEASLLTEE